jgi:hypothetical protein
MCVYYENRTEHTDTVRTSQETHYVSAIEPNRLMLFGETAAVYCENQTEHTYSPYLTGKTLRLRYRAQPVNAVWGNSRCLVWEPYGTHRYSQYLTRNTLRLRYKAQPVNAVWGNSRCLLWEPYGTHRHRYTVWAIRRFDWEHVSYVEQPLQRGGSVCNGNKIVINICEDEDIREHRSSWSVSIPGREHTSGGGGGGRK